MIYTVYIQPGGYTLFVVPGETVLQAALRQGYIFPWACQQAICGSCQGKIISGSVTYDVPLYAITEEQQQQGQALFCSAKPTSDLTIEIEGVEEPHTYPIKEVTCAVIDYQELTGQVLRILLQQPDIPFIYRAGQYVEIILPKYDARPFSIANAPNKNQLEFHLRHFADNAYMQSLIQQIKIKKQLTLKGPFGYLRYQRNPSYPLLLIASGTGFAPYKALLEQLWQDPQHPPVYLYWGVRTGADLYWHTQLLDWSKKYSRFYYYPVLSQPLLSDRWLGLVGTVQEAILKQHSQFNYFHIYASGQPEMVFAVKEAVLARGAANSRFYSDWLDFPMRGK